MGERNRERERKKERLISKLGHIIRISEDGYPRKRCNSGLYPCLHRVAGEGIVVGENQGG